MSSHFHFHNDRKLSSNTTNSSLPNQARLTICFQLPGSCLSFKLWKNATTVTSPHFPFHDDRRFLTTIQIEIHSIVVAIISKSCYRRSGIVWKIPERLSGLLLSRGASGIFGSVCEMYGHIKTTQLIPRLQTLPFPKPAHLQWAQDQGVWEASGLVKLTWSRPAQTKKSFIFILWSFGHKVKMLYLAS